MTFRIIFWAVALSGGMSFATEQAPSIRSSSRLPSDEIKSNVTQEFQITNPELRAQDGSRSKYSLKVTLAYTGPPIGTPLEPMRPNPDNSPGDYRTRMSGSVGLRYRLPVGALNFGAGVRMFTPFHGVEEFDAQDPFVSYDRSRRVGQWQMRQSVSGSATTTDNYVRRGQVASASYSASVKYGLVDWPLSFGWSSGLSVFGFQRSYRSGDGNVGNYFLNLSPGLEYQLLPSFNINASIYQGFTNLRKSDNWVDWDVRSLTGRLGLGISITREIYLRPYLDFYPQAFNWKTTTASFSTVFSIF